MHILGPTTKNKIKHIVFNFSLEDCNTQKKKLKAKVMQTWRGSKQGVLWEISELQKTKRWRELSLFPKISNFRSPDGV